MPPKYEFTDEVDERLGFPTLRRIRAVRDFGDVKAGTLGGWIGSEYNLSHEGLAWVADEAKVYEDACILGDAKVCGNAIVRGLARVRENAVIDENAVVFGVSHISGNAKIIGATILCDVVVDNNAIVGAVQISGLARLGVGARAQSERDYLLCGPIGQNNSFVTFYRAEKPAQIGVAAGCFNGTLDEFLDRLQEDYGRHIHLLQQLKATDEASRLEMLRDEYLEIAAFAERRFARCAAQNNERNANDETTKENAGRIETQDF